MPDSRPAANEATDAIARLRRFNRMYTRCIGTLNEAFLDTEFNLAEGRVLYELVNGAAGTASRIAAELGLDPGYLSRLLRAFEQKGLVARRASRQDARSAILRLTPKGKSAFKKLNALSDQQAQSILYGLAPGPRMQLLHAMQTIEDVLAGTPAPRPLVLRPHRVGDMGWVVYSEAAGYATQFGWDNDFEALVAKIVGDFLTNFDSRCERCWIAEIDGEHVGHIFLVKHPEQPQTAKLRLLFVEPSARGKGLGDALVNECIRFARTAGYARVVLWTQSILTAAHRIYQRAGFRLVKEEPHHSFGHDLVGQEWELELQ